jgi:hypothetical protein
MKTFTPTATTTLRDEFIILSVKTNESCDAGEGYLKCNHIAISIHDKELKRLCEY